MAHRPALLGAPTLIAVLLWLSGWMAYKESYVVDGWDLGLRVPTDLQVYLLAGQRLNEGGLLYDGPSGTSSDVPELDDPTSGADTQVRSRPELHERVRTYTVRRVDAENGRLQIDFVMHGDEGIAGPWAAAARPGPVSSAAVAPRPADQVLEAAVLPWTARSIRGIIVPMAAPRREKRTTIVNYTVQSGDNVIRIAHQFGLDVSTVLWANPVLEDDPDLLAIGQDLKILPVDGTLYTVLRGDSVEAIAAKHKVEVSAIVDYPANGLSGGATLQAGQVLVIPGGEKPYVPKPTPTPRPAPTRAPAQAPAAPVQVPSASGSLLWPMQGVISQGYWVAQYASHRAIDIAAPTGTPIYAAENGVVTHVQWNLWPYGTMVMVTHDNGMKTLYAHMSALNVANGQTVSKGDQLGACGSTGRSTGPHVHFEVIRNGAQVNPLLYLP